MDFVNELVEGESNNSVVVFIFLFWGYFSCPFCRASFFDKLIFRPLKWPPGVFDGTGRRADDSGVTGSATADEKKKSNLKSCQSFERVAMV